MTLCVVAKGNENDTWISNICVKIKIEIVCKRTYFYTLLPLHSVTSKLNLVLLFKSYLISKYSQMCIIYTQMFKFESRHFVKV